MPQRLIALAEASAYIGSGEVGMGLVSTIKSAAAAVSFAMIGMTGLSASSFGAQEATPYRANRLFYGCWTKTTVHDRKRWPISIVYWCFERGRTIDGLTDDAGDSWDYCLRWRASGQHLMVDDGYNDVRRCIYAFSEDKRTLILRDCSSAGEWRRDDERTKIIKGSRACRPPETPDTEDSPHAKE